MPWDPLLGLFEGEIAGTFPDPLEVDSAPYLGVSYAVELGEVPGLLPVTTAWVEDDDLAAAPADLAFAWDPAMTGSITHVVLAAVSVGLTSYLVSCVEPVASGSLAIPAGTVPVGTAYDFVGITGAVRVQDTMDPATAEVDAVHTTPGYLLER